MKIISKVLIGLAGLVGGALIERGITGYGEDISELRKKDDPEIEDIDTDEDDSEAAEAEPEETEEAEPEEES